MIEALPDTRTGGPTEPLDLGAEVAGLTRSELVVVLRARQAAVVAAEAAMAVAVAAMGDAWGMDPEDEWDPDDGRAERFRSGPDGMPGFSEFAGTELGPVLGVSPGSAEWEIRSMLVLRHRHPRMWQAVVTGSARVWQARKLIGLTGMAALTLTQARWVDEQLALVVGRVTFARLVHLTEGLIVAADTAAAEARRVAAARARFVRLIQHGNGLAWLEVRGSAHDLMVFNAMVDHLADLLGLDGDSSSKDVRRATAVGVLANPAQAVLLLQRHHGKDSVADRPDEPAAPAPMESEEVALVEPAEPAEERGRIRDGRNLPTPDRTPPNDSFTTHEPDTNEPAAALVEPAERAEERGRVRDGRNLQPPDHTPPNDSFTTHRADSPEPDTDRLWAEPEPEPDDLPPPDDHGPADRPWPRGPWDLPDPDDPGPPDPHPEWGPAAPFADTAKIIITTPPDRLRPRAVLYVHVSADTLRDQDGQVRVEQIGAVTAQQARAWLNHAHVRIQPVIDLASGACVDAYELTGRLREQVVVRDVYEVFPFGQQPARACDLDHATPFRLVKATDPADVNPLSRTAHRAKTHGGWTRVNTTPGRTDWTSPTGQHYTVDHGRTL